MLETSFLNTYRQQQGALGNRPKEGPRTLLLRMHVLLFSYVVCVCVCVCLSMGLAVRIAV